MPETRLALSEYRAMWLFAMFDMPVETREQRREQTRFRNALKREGFSMLQYSVYARYCPSEESAEVYRRHVKATLPHEGQVRMLAVTDRQFAKMEIFYGEKAAKVEQAPQQLMLF
jgi:CRISPR-associated protein Cas2